jgi:hypothetical protein
MKKCSWLILFVACTPIASPTTSSGTSKTLQLSDHVYENQIKTVRLFTRTADLRSELNPAVTKIGQKDLILEFDDLVDQRDSYYAKIIHCTRDWNKSLLSDLDYMMEYNEFPINTFDFSLDTHIPYVHYRFNLPLVKLPGNYVLVVYRGSNQEDIILTKRFMVYDPKISFVREGSLVGAGSLAQRNQQINFTVNYKNIDIINPMETVSVTIRQNQRWDNLAENIKPSFIRDYQFELEYRFFDDAKMFKGGNEFRFFDIRSLNYPGQNVASIKKDSKPYQAFIATDQSRAGLPYAQYLDLNGGYIIQNLDYPSELAANYVQVHFSLQSPTPINGNVYAISSFSNWKHGASTRMHYDSTRREYQFSQLLKQGYYNYQYYVQSEKIPATYFEGTHYETENFYEIFVYYRSFQPQADLLVGYYVMEENQR